MISICMGSRRRMYGGLSLICMVIAGSVALLVGCGSSSSSGTGPGTGSASQISLTIASGSSLSFEEGGSAELVIAATPAPSSAIEVQLQIAPAPGGYLVEGDGISVGAAASDMLPVSVALDASNPMRTMRVVATDDTDDQSLSVRLQAGSGYELPAESGRALALSVDDVPVASLASDRAALNEGASVRAMITVSLDEAQTEPVTVRLQIDQTAPDADVYSMYPWLTYAADYAVTDADEAEVDMEEPPGASNAMSRHVDLTIESGTDASWRLAAIEDDDGLDETLTLTLLDGAGYRLADEAASADIAVTDNEPTITSLTWSTNGRPMFPFYEGLGETSRPVFQATGMGTLAANTELRVQIDGDIVAGDIGRYQDVSGTPECVGNAIGSGGTGTVIVRSATSLVDTFANIEFDNIIFQCTTVDADTEDEIFTIIFLPDDGYRVVLGANNRPMYGLDVLACEVDRGAVTVPLSGC